MANKNKFQEIRVQNDAATRFMLLTLKEHHQQNGDEAWIAVPDLAQAMGSSPDAVDRLVREVAEQDHSILVESARLHGFTDDRYKRGNEKGWWTAVRRLPPEIVEKRRQKLERAAFLVNEAFRIAYGDRVKFQAIAYDDGSVAVRGLEEGQSDDVLELILAADPKNDGKRKSGSRSASSHSR